MRKPRGNVMSQGPALELVGTSTGPMAKAFIGFLVSFGRNIPRLWGSAAIEQDIRIAIYNEIPQLLFRHSGIRKQRCIFVIVVNPIACRRERNTTGAWESFTL